MSDDYRPFSMLYHDLVDDPKFERVYPDHRLFSHWTKLLMAADASYPASAPIPRWAEPDALAVLEEVGLIVVRGDHYTLKGLPAERTRRAARGRAGGLARAASATRDDAGRYGSGDPWADFGPEWAEFRKAWQERGFVLPPYGQPTDELSQRAIVWQVLDARPKDCVRWVREAPEGATRKEVVGYVLGKWREQKGKAA